MSLSQKRLGLVALACFGAILGAAMVRCDTVAHDVESEAHAWRRPIGARGGPAITSFSPTSGCAGDGIELFGSGFSGATAVSLNGTAATFVVNSSAVITATIPNGASTGTWKVTTPLGSVNSLSSYTIGACLFTFNLTSNPPPTGITTTRTGSDMLAQNSASTVQTFTAAQGYVWEDLGDGGGGGLWSFDAHPNDVPAWNTFTAGAGWTNVGASVTTSSIATGPDGVANSASGIQTAAGACSGISSSAIGALDSCLGVATIWSRNGSPAPSPLPGAIYGNINASGANSLQNNTTWTRTYGSWSKAAFGGNLANYFGLRVAGEPATSSGFPACDGVSTGGIYAFGAQSIAACDHGIIPTIAGTSTSAEVVAPAAAQLPNSISGNDMHLRGCWLVDRLFTSNITPTDSVTPRVWSMVTADGESVIKWNNQTVFEAYFNGDTLHPVDLNVGYLDQAKFSPMLTCFEWWSQPSTVTSGFEMILNGMRAYSGGVAPLPSVYTMHTPTGMWLGSEKGGAGTGPGFAVRWTDLQRVGSDPNIAEFAILGDSLLSSFPPYVAAGPAIYTVNQARARPGIASFAFPGETIAQQQARWDASAQKGQSYIKAVLILIGTNNIGGGGFTDVTAAAALQGLINDVHTGNPTAKIVLAPNLPVNCNYNATIQGYFANYNLDILGTGPNPITDPGGGVLAVMPMWTSLSGGPIGPSTYCYLPQYNSGDNIHENNLARITVVGPAFASELTSLGLLQ